MKAFKFLLGGIALYTAIAAAFMWYVVIRYQ